MGRIPLLLIILVLAAVLMPSAILLAVLMVPSLVVYVIDRNPHRYFTVTISLPNFCGVLPPLMELWERGQTFDGAFSALSDPWNMMIAYGAAGLGWVLYLGTPIFVSSYLSISTDGKIKAIRRYQDDLIDAWGDGVKQSVTVAPEEGVEPQEEEVS
ncbi:hypothetical protein WH95_13955 [Kiloniella litopenaei]|uniref:Uncharacterized protein n=1 Tax=Kiloniella litopenaei TaxID=1549748 RepID=A0A0M2R9N8_9PROT|nr:hypothetical protein [Kiloniella litopenaei]KKJ76313.1 hypothetical protein WH95_13955 [Kiloniella litopenaei]